MAFIGREYVIRENISKVKEALLFLQARNPAPDDVGLLRLKAKLAELEQKLAAL